MTDEEFTAHFNLQLGIFADKPAHDIPYSTRLREDFGFDELDVVEFIVSYPTLNGWTCEGNRAGPD